MSWGGEATRAAAIFELGGSLAIRKRDSSAAYFGERIGNPRSAASDCRKLQSASQTFPFPSTAQVQRRGRVSLESRLNRNRECGIRRGSIGELSLARRALLKMPRSARLARPEAFGVDRGRKAVSLKTNTSSTKIDAETANWIKENSPSSEFVLHRVVELVQSTRGSPRSRNVSVG